MEINVTDADISAGLRQSADMDPIALALKRSFGIKDVGVFPNGIKIGPRVLEIPEVVRLKLTIWDAGGDMEPFNFKLVMPECDHMWIADEDTCTYVCTKCKKKITPSS